MSNARRRCCSLLGSIFLATVLGSTPASSETLADLRPGDRVRLTILDGDEDYSGRLLTASSTIVQVDHRGEELEFAIADLERIQKADGTRHAFRRGALFGVLGGAAIGGLANWMSHDRPYAYNDAIFLGVLVAVIGTVVGGVVGTTDWVTVTPTFPDSSRGSIGGASVTVDF